MSKDEIFTFYIDLLIPDDFIDREKAIEANKMMDTYANFAAMNEAQKLMLATNLGFEDFEALTAFTDAIGQSREKLEKEYNLSAFTWEQLKPIYEEALSNALVKRYDLGNKKGAKVLVPSEWDRCKKEDDDRCAGLSVIPICCKVRRLDDYLSTLNNFETRARNDINCISNFNSVPPDEACTDSSESYTKWKGDLNLVAQSYENCVIISCTAI